MRPGEKDILLIAKTLVEGSPLPNDIMMGLREQKTPSLIYRNTDKILKTLLSRGVILHLARQGGWIADPNGVRWWDSNPSQIRYSVFSVQFLRFLLDKSINLPPAKGLGDELLIWIAAKKMPEQAIQNGVFHTPFCALVRSQAPRYTNWIDIPQDRFKLLSILVSPQDILKEHREIVNTVDPIVFRDRCVQQEETYSSLLDTAWAKKEWKIITRVLQAAILSLRDKPEFKLNPKMSMGDRSAAKRSYGYLSRFLIKIQGWKEQLQDRRFFDEDFAEAQYYLRQWDALTPIMVDKANNYLKALEEI
jgi:hypothetical protein